MSAPEMLPTTGDAAVDAALSGLRPAAERPHEDPLAATAAIAVTHEALRVRLAAATG